MVIFFDLLTILIISIIGFYIARFKIIIDTSQNRRSESNLEYYGYVVALWAFVGGTLSTIFTKIIYPSDLWSSYIGINTSLGILIFSFIILRRSFKARHHLDIWWNSAFFIASLTSILIILSIICIVVYYSGLFFSIIPIQKFIFGTSWSPTTYKHDLENSFGALPVFFGTFYIALISLLLSVPLGILSSVYLSEYASKKVRNFFKPLVEILAGIPTIVYGYIAAVLIGPIFRDIGEFFSISSSNENILAAGIVMGIMITPLIVTLSDDAIYSVPNELKYASLSLGSTKTEAIRKIVLPAASRNIICSIIIAFSRAIGETMIVVMACGLVAKFHFNPFESNTTVTAQIVNLLTGDESFDNPKTLSAFALALFLLVVTLILNLISISIIKNKAR